VSSLTAGRAASFVAVVALAAALVAGSARAATSSLSFSSCGTANNGFQFTITGAGFVGYPGLDLQVTSSEPGATANPNYVLAPAAEQNPFVGAVASLNADGSFSLPFNAGAGQLLPAKIGVYTIDDYGNNLALIYSTTVGASTACADLTNFLAARTWLPKTKADCEHSWSQFAAFRNQGDCVSYITTVGGNKPAPPS
jgi:hypothetical protein